MANFNVNMDVTSGKIAMIQRALQLRQEAALSGRFMVPQKNADGSLPTSLGPIEALTNNGTMLLFASSWSPPAWLKTTNSRIHGSLNGTAGDAVHKAYALYLSKFLDAYKAHGIEVGLISLQNEPNTKKAEWDTCTWTAEAERDFIKTDFGPLMKQNHPDVGLIMLDDQRIEMDAWMEIVLSDPAAAQYVNVTGVHWYTSVDDIIDEFEYMAWAHAKFPNIQLLATEVCV